MKANIWRSWKNARLVTGTESNWDWSPLGKTFPTEVRMILNHILYKGEVPREIRKQLREYGFTKEGYYDVRPKRTMYMLGYA